MRCAVLLLSLSAGCGPGEDTRVAELEADELARFCEELGGPEGWRCAFEDVAIDYRWGDDCPGYYGAFSEDCPVTLEMVRQCEQELRAAYDEDPCRTDVPVSCEPVMDCQLDVG